MPIEELRKYSGINPCPSDMDQFWQAGLDEMHAVNPNIELVKSDFQTDFAECYHLYFDGVKGARVHAKLLKPKGKVKCPAIVEFHGYSGSSGDWYTKLGYVANGFVVASMDCRGQGGLSEDSGIIKGTTHSGHIIRGLDDKPENFIYRQIFLDTAQLASIVINMADVDADRVVAKGGSQGGALTIACAALEPRIKKLAPVHPFLADYKRILELDVETSAYIEIRNYFRKFDPLHEREDEIFKNLGYIDVQHLAKRIKGEVMMFVTLRDDICPPSTQFAVYNKIQAAKQLQIYPDFGHEALPQADDKTFEFLSDI